MLRIGQVETTATSDSKYTDGSVAGGVAATRLRAAAFNAIQEELAHIVESAGLTLDVNDTTQVLAAIKSQTVGRLINIRVFTSSGTYTPTAGTKKFRSRLIGAGGAGGGAVASTVSGYICCSDGGGGGTYGETGLIDATAISSVSVIVGLGGTSVIGGNGSTGGNSSFGAYITAPGGTGGNTAVSGSPTNSLVSDKANTADCSGTNVLINIPGQGAFGQMSFSSSASTNNQVRGGKGGSSFLGQGGGASTLSTLHYSGSGYGAGGAGAVTVYAQGTSAVIGGNGTNGIVIVEEYA